MNLEGMKFRASISFSDVYQMDTLTTNGKHVLEVQGSDALRRLHEESRWNRHPRWQAHGTGVDSKAVQQRDESLGCLRGARRKSPSKQKKASRPSCPKSPPAFHYPAFHRSSPGWPG